MTATEGSVDETLITISRQISDWINTWPEQMRPEYKPLVFAPGTLVEHIMLPGVTLEIVEGPKELYDGRMQYRVKLPNGDVVPVLAKNLMIYEGAAENATKQVNIA